MMLRKNLFLSFALVAILSTCSFGQDYFTGGTSSDWDDATNWASGALPDGSQGQVVVGSTVSGSSMATANITGALTNVGVGELRVGSSAFNDGMGNHIAGSTGTVNHSGGQLDAAGWSFIGHDGNPGGGVNLGTYNLSGSAVLNAGAVWALGVGGSGGVNEGIMNVSGGTMNVNGDGGLAIGWDLGNSGTLNQTGGTVNSNWSTVGANSVGTVGTFNMSGGQYNSSLTIGENDGAMGTTNVSATADMNLDLLLVGRNDGSTGTLNIDGSTSTIDVTGACYVGHRSPFEMVDPSLDTTAVGTISYTLDSNGVTPLNCGGDVLLSPDGANLVVDASAFSGTGDILLIDNMGANAIGGGFIGLAQGDMVPGSGGRTIDYMYGDGNNVALVIPEPSGILLLMSCFGGLLLRRKS